MIYLKIEVNNGTHLIPDFKDEDDFLWIDIVKQALLEKKTVIIRKVEFT